MKIEVFEELPAKKIGKRAKRPKYYNLAREIKARPGVWITASELKGVKSPSLSTLIKKGGLVSFQPAGAFDAAARKNDTGSRYTVFVRYIGESGDAA